MTRRERSSSARAWANTLLTPEGVPLAFQVAGVGVRMGAQIIDVAITLLAAAAILILLVTLGVAAPGTVAAIASLLFFAIRIPYYVATELIWNGQTLGKRFLKIKVVSNDGGPLSTNALVVRNLMKEAEVFLPGTLVLTLDSNTPEYSLIAFLWVIATLAVPVFNKRRRRLGDYAAGTYVIHLPQPVLLPDLAQQRPISTTKTDQFTFLSHHLDHYGAYELQTLEDLLRAGENNTNSVAQQNRSATLQAVTDRIRRKIDYAEHIPEERRAEFLLAFYNAQRAHLEQKQLFGERRADKHHAASDKEKSS